MKQRNSVIVRAVFRFRQLGGFRLLRQYVRLGILGKSIKRVLYGLYKRHSLKTIYGDLLNQVTPTLQKKYQYVVTDTIRKYDGDTIEGQKSEKIWFCWLQGLESAPDLVKSCYSSLRRHIKEKEIIVVDETNINEYVALPEIIEERWKKKQIPSALYSDIIRLELLIKYGGTWIDATVFCSGSSYPKEYLDADLFLFQFSRPEDKHFCGISNWFITSCKNHPLLMMTRDLLCLYWEEYDCVLNFFVFHLFFSMIVKERPELIKNMPYGFSPNSLLLEHHLGEKFVQEKWDRLISKVSFHKLTYRLGTDVTSTPGNYYEKIIRNGEESE